MRILSKIIDVYFEERQREKEKIFRNQLREVCNQMHTTHDRFTRNYYLKYNKQEKDLLKQCVKVAKVTAPKEKLKHINKLERKLEQHKIYWKLENNFN